MGKAVQFLDVFFGVPRIPQWTTWKPTWIPARSPFGVLPRGAVQVRHTITFVPLTLFSTWKGGRGGCGTVPFSVLVVIVEPRTAADAVPSREDNSIAGPPALGTDELDSNAGLPRNTGRKGAGTACLSSIRSRWPVLATGPDAPTHF